MANLIEAGIFDAGGVLHSVNLPAIHQDIKTTLGLDDDTFKQAWQSLTPLLGVGKITEADYWRQFLKLTGSTVSLPEESLFLREYKKDFSINEDVMEVVKELKRAGLSLAVLSNTIAPHTAFNKSVGLYDPFEVQVLSNEVGLHKPDPKIYQLAVERLGTSFKKSFFVDDLEANVEAFEVLGGKGIFFENAQQLRRDLAKLGVQLEKSL